MEDFYEEEDFTISKCNVYITWSFGLSISYLKEFKHIHIILPFTVIVVGLSDYNYDKWFEFTINL